MNGGITNFDKIQKVLDLGANAFISGYIFALAEEACGEIGYAKSHNEFQNQNFIRKE